MRETGINKGDFKEAAKGIEEMQENKMSQKGMQYSHKEW